MACGMGHLFGTKRQRGWPTATLRREDSQGIARACLYDIAIPIASKDPQRARTNGTDTQVIGWSSDEPALCGRAAQHRRDVPA